MSTLKLSAFLLLPLCLAACENSATSYMIEGKDHSISLVREQHLIWSSEVDQILVPARFPQCQRRHHIDADNKAMTAMELYEVEPMLYVIHQGNNWYAVGTEECQVQKFDKPPAVPGRLLGSFQRRNDELAFVPAESPAKPIGK